MICVEEMWNVNVGMAEKKIEVTETALLYNNIENEVDENKMLDVLLSGRVLRKIWQKD